MAPEDFQLKNCSFSLTYENVCWRACTKQRPQITAKLTDQSRNLVLSMELA